MPDAPIEPVEPIESTGLVDIEALCAVDGGRDRRMLASWMSYRDFIELVGRALSVPRVGYLVVYGISDNDELFWDNRAARVLGYRPQDNAESFRAEIEAKTPVPDPFDPATRFVGGGFCAAGHFED